MPRAQARRFPRQLNPYLSGPYVEMIDAVDPATARPGVARFLGDCYIPAGVPGTAVKGRPGSTLAGNNAGSPLGGVGARKSQLTVGWTRLDGTQFNVQIVGGKFYTYSFGSNAWTETLTAAHFAAATGGAITLSTTARCYAVVLANTLIVNDGINRMWAWDGTAGAGLTRLDNIPFPIFGQPWVYAAKLFVILANDRKAFAWSEENTPATGYNAGGYSNIWDFVQTGTEQLTAGAGTNECMYIFRARSIARIQGQVNDAFKTSATRTDVHDTVGTTGTPLVTNRGVVFVSADGWPHVITPGGGVIDASIGLRTTLAATNQASLAAAIILDYPPLEAVLVGLPVGSATYANMWCMLRLAGDAGARCVGVLRTTAAGSAAVLPDSLGDLRWMRAGNDDGYAYVHGLPDGSTWNDDTVSASTIVPMAIPHEVTGAELGVDVAVAKIWDRLDIMTGADGTDVYTVDYAMPSMLSESLPITVTGAVGSLLGVGLLGTFVLAGITSEKKTSVGIAGESRWLRPRVRHDTLGKQFSFSAFGAHAFESTDDATVL